MHASLWIQRGEQTCRIQCYQWPCERVLHKHGLYAHESLRAVFSSSSASHHNKLSVLHMWGLTNTVDLQTWCYLGDGC